MLIINEPWRNLTAWNVWTCSRSNHDTEASDCFVRRLCGHLDRPHVFGPTPRRCRHLQLADAAARFHRRHRTLHLSQETPLLLVLYVGSHTAQRWVDTSGWGLLLRLNICCYVLFCSSRCNFTLNRFFTVSCKPVILSSVMKIGEFWQNCWLKICFKNIFALNIQNRK